MADVTRGEEVPDGGLVGSRRCALIAGKIYSSGFERGMCTRGIWMRGEGNVAVRRRGAVGGGNRGEYGGKMRNRAIVGASRRSLGKV